MHSTTATNIDQVFKHSTVLWRRKQILMILLRRTEDACAFFFSPSVINIRVKWI